MIQEDEDEDSEDGEHTLFALQVFIPQERGTQLARRELVRLLRESPAEPSTRDKALFYKQLIARLQSLLPDAHFGIWDYIDDNERALDEYEQWCQGTIDDAQQEADLQEQPLDSPRYLFVTILLLCDAEANADLQLQAAAEVAEVDPWTRSTFSALLAAIAELDWRAVKSDTLFIRPGEGGLGVTDEALREAHYHYLQPLL